MNIKIKIKYKFFEPGKKNNNDHQPSASPDYNFYKQMTKTRCVGGRSYSDTNNVIEYEKVNPKTHKVVKIIKGTCSICRRDKSQMFTR